MTTETIPAVRKQITVEATAARAFKVFTEGFDGWWPRSHHIGKVDVAEAVIEPRTGGRWYERGVDGTECEWGRVLAWEPPTRLVLAWQIGPDWTHDPARTSEVEVRFVPEAPGRTRVELTHRGLDVYGAAADEMRTAVDSDGGWNGLLVLFGDAVAAA